MKLLVRDEDDLRIVASALQDAVVRMDTLRHRPGARAFELVASRYMHEMHDPRRTLSGLRVDGVLSAKYRGLDRDKPEAFAVLLDIAFEATDAPGGALTLTFADGGAIRLDVEALEIAVADVGAPRRARAVPDHGD